MDDYYKLNDQIKIFLYGAGTLGSIVGKLLTEKNFNLVGYIDKRADEIRSLNIKKCFALYDLKYLKEKAKYCIIITVKDVFEHETIKCKLEKLGFYKIIYKPMLVLNGKGSSNQQLISNVYDEIINNTFNSSTKIPYIDKSDIFSFNITTHLAQKNTNNVFYIPTELIYTNRSNSNMCNWGDICIYGMVPHIELFKFFGGDYLYSVDNYIAFCMERAKASNIEITESWKQNVLRNRYNIFKQMIQYLAIDSEFFIRNAPEASWNIRGYFNLCSGKHRASFLATQGFPYIACKISKEDYEKWANISQLEKFCNYFVFEQRDLDYIPENPHFIGLRNVKGELWKDILRILEFWICKLSLNKNMIPCYKGKRLLDLTKNSCYLTRNLLKYGLKVCRIDITESCFNMDNQLLVIPDVISEYMYEVVDYVVLDFRNSEDTDIFDEIKAKVYFIIVSGISKFEKLYNSTTMIMKKYCDGELISMFMYKNEGM